MAATQGSTSAAPPKSPTIHEATLASGPSGAVIKGAEIDFATAAARRQAGLDVVVCSDELSANRSLAKTIEAAVGPPSKPQKPHSYAGPAALPHFHQRTRSTSYPPKKARKNP